MKRTTALYAVAVIAAFTFAGQAFARGGSMGGGQGHGNTGGTQQMTATMQPGSGNVMQQRTMQSSASQHGSAVGSGPENMKQGGSGNSVVRQNGQNSPAPKQPPVTTAAD